MEQMSPLLQARIEQQQALNNSNQNNIAQQSYVDLTQKLDTFENSNKQKDKGDKGKIAKIIAIGTAITVATVGIIYAVKKGKSINLSDITPDKFKQIQTDKFTGKIKGKLKNGDKVVMEYVDGVLKKSTRTGEVNFEKTYETINNEKIVKKNVSGVTTEFNITKTQQEVKAAQEKLKNILSDKNLSSDELKKQTDAIKFKSKNQKKEIENTINSKKKAEAEEKVKIEVQKKQGELDRITKAKAEAEQKAKIEAEEKAKIEAQKKQEFLDRVAKAKAEDEARAIAQKIAAPKNDKIEQEILDAIGDVKFQEITKSYCESLDAEKVDYSQEIVRHATTPEYAESIRKNGYDIYHSASNKGTSTYGGMDVESESLLNFGKRYGTTKLEYEFSGRALRLTEQIEDVVDRMRSSLLWASGKFNGTCEYKGLSMGDMDKSFTRKILKRLGYDAVIFEQNGQDKFLTILDPNDTNVLKYIRTISA